MTNQIITISREYGSGGRDIGRLLAEELGLPLFDKEIMHLALEKSGMTTDFVEKHGESVPSKLMLSFQRFSQNVPNIRIPSGFNSHTVAAASTRGGKDSATKEDQLFKAQSAAIKELAKAGGCVIVGRCAGHILRDQPKLLSVFIRADFDDRVARTTSVYGRDPQNAIADVKQIDKHRANYYKLHTHQNWGDAKNYDLMINTSYTDVAGAVAVIRSMLEKKSHVQYIN